MSRIARIIKESQKPVDASSLIVFHIAFGVILLWAVYRYVAYGRITRYFINSVFHFKYYGFGWVEAWPGNGMY